MREEIDRSYGTCNLKRCMLFLFYKILTVYNGLFLQK